MPYIKEQSAIFTKLKGTAQHNYGSKPDSFFITDCNEEKHNIEYVTQEQERISKNMRRVSFLKMKVGGKYLSDIKTGPIAVMSSMLTSFTSVQTVLLYISNYPERVKLMYRKDSDIYALFEVYSDQEMQDMWNVNYLIGQIDMAKYSAIIDNSITGIKSFFVTGIEKKATNLNINLGLNLEIKIYE